jgi:signal transduction histidine kinase
MNFVTPLPYAAAIAFAALGANLLGTALLILINPGSRAVRWHAAFMFWIMAWLALQGWFTLGRGGPELLPVYYAVIHLMPAFFLAASLVETRQVGNAAAIGLIAVAAASLLVLSPATPAGIPWQAALWGSAAVLHFRNRSRRHPDAARAGTVRGGELAIKLALLVVVPISVISIIVLGGGFVLYAMPLITILIQFLIFVGVVHHRFYDVEVRAARSGELAAGAAEQERLALLGEVSATLAHEIRNPLTGMRSLAQRLTGSDIDEERRTRYAGVILGEIERLERIVGNLLDVGRRSVVRQQEPQATALQPLFDDILLLVDGRAKRAQVILERADAGDLAAAAPRDALAQTLLNLLINAVTHTPRGGRVRLAATRTGEWIEVRVDDSGPGVPPADRERIFEPFHTHGLGAGLGLAVVRRLARELDWRVTVGDAPGGGASFRVRVPAAPASRQRPGTGRVRDDVPATTADTVAQP